jgi:hypothetical protein
MCNGVTTTGTAASAPCPIVIGDPSGTTIGWYSDGEPPLVVLKEQVPTESMLPILEACRFSYDEPNNLTVITPLTHET